MLSWKGPGEEEGLVNPGTTTIMLSLATLSAVRKEERVIVLRVTEQVGAWIVPLSVAEETVTDEQRVALFAEVTC